MITFQEECGFGKEKLGMNKLMVYNIICARGVFIILLCTYTHVANVNSSSSSFGFFPSGVATADFPSANINTYTIILLKSVSLSVGVHKRQVAILAR